MYKLDPRDTHRIENTDRINAGGHAVFDDCVNSGAGGDRSPGSVFGGGGQWRMHGSRVVGDVG